MKSVFQVAADEKWSDENWLIVGKGPSFANLYDVAWRGPVFCLNHTIDVLRRSAIDYVPSKTVAHIIDLEVVEEIPDALLSNCCKYVVMPFVPNQDMHRGNDTLSELVAKNPVFKALERKLLVYNRKRSLILKEGCGSVDVRCFSAEAAFDILAQAGVKRITTCGIDGGREHHKEFADQALANGRKSFDDQFARIGEIVAKHKIEVDQLCTRSPVSK